MLFFCALLGLGLAVTSPTLIAQPAPSTVHAVHRPFDELLDIYVRDGFVYYNALRSDRGKLDRYLAGLNAPGALALANGTADEKKAFWLNAYNALVLRTVIDHFPIRGRASHFPSNSIRQIPGAFEKASHRVAGQLLSLDAIEKEMLAPLGDPRVFLALGRGAYGGGRLRSEAFDAPTVDALLNAVAAESVTRAEVVKVDTLANVVSLSPIFSWREAVFTQALAEKADRIFAQRSGIERAVLALIEPHLVGAEAEFLEKNTFKMQFHEFDWRLNDLSSRSF